MLKISTATPVDIIKYEKYLNFENPSCYISAVGLQLVQQSTEAKLISYEHKLDDLMLSLSGGTLTSFTKDSFLYLLTRVYNLPQDLFMIKGRNNLSLDKKDVIAPLIIWLNKNKSQNSSYIDLLEIVELYEIYNSLKYINGNLKSLIQAIMNCPMVPSCLNEPLAKVSFSYIRRQNNRYYTKEPNLQNLTKTANWCLQSPEGYVLVSADAAQADLRIACETILNQDSKFKKFYLEEREDKYRAVAKYIKYLNNQPFVEEEFQELRPAYKVSILAAIYGSRSATSLSGFKTPEDRAQLISFIENNPGYKKYDQDFNKALESSADTLRVYNVFGGVTEWDTRAHNIGKEIRNSPIQSSTSAILAVWSMAILDKFYSLGYTEDDIKIFLNRHDEIIFLMKEEALKDAWIFKDYSSVAIDDWDEYAFEPKFYYKYKEFNQSLQDTYDEVCSKNAHRIEPFQRQESAGRKYDFIGSTVRVYSYAPVVLQMFLLENEKAFNLDLTALKQLPKGETSRRFALAQEIVNKLLTSPDTPAHVIYSIETFKKYYDIYAVEVAPNEYKYLQGRTSLDKYCKDNFIKIITLYNTLLYDKTVSINGLTYCFVKKADSYIEEILNRYLTSKALDEYSAKNLFEQKPVSTVITDSATSTTSLFSNAVEVSNRIVRMFENIPIFEDELSYPDSVAKWV